MARKFGLRVFRKPRHWSEERYEEYLKKKKYYRTLEELNASLISQKG